MAFVSTVMTHLIERFLDRTVYLGQRMLVNRFEQNLGKFVHRHIQIFMLL
jgi:hypothetical protein